MRVLVTGVNGQLGYDVVKELKKRGHNPVGVDREQMDLTVPSQIKECIDRNEKVIDRLSKSLYGLIKASMIK